MRRYLIIALAFLRTWIAFGANSPRISEPVDYYGCCGASAGAALDSKLFVVADDEANQLRIYSRETNGLPLTVMDLTADLQLDRRAPETDIEGAARIGDRIYWITSHSRNKEGREHPNRCRLFATSVRMTNGAPQLAFAGRPYKDLLTDLVNAPQLKSFRLAAASRLAPKAVGALNIEGLCASPTGQLFIGFRNPVPGGKALVVPLENPDDVISGRRARFGTPLLLDMNGLSIRDMVYVGGRFLIIGGPFDGGGKSKLFSWNGIDAAPKHLKEIDLKGLNPEALIAFPDTGLEEIQVLSDDSGHQDQKKPCKVLNEADRTFRSVVIHPGLKHHRLR